MARLTKHSRCLFIFSAAAALALGQPAPQRSDELCQTLKQTATENSRSFTAQKPGACLVNIDTGYNLFVDYDPQTLHIGLQVNPVLLNGDAAAFWLRLSALDSLVQSAMGTKSRALFDAMSGLSKKLAVGQLKGDARGTMIHAKTDHVTLGAVIEKPSDVMLLIASASVADIDKMHKTREAEAARVVPTWRRILALSLRSFAAGSQGYVNAYRASHATVHSCYTNFTGISAVTNCY